MANEGELSYSGAIRELTRAKEQLVAAWERYTDARATSLPDEYEDQKAAEIARLEKAQQRVQDAHRKIGELLSEAKLERERGPSEPADLEERDDDAGNG